MRILYINHYAGSPHHGMEFRPFYLAREWVRSGHTVQMLAASFSHVRAKQPAVGNGPISQPTKEWIDGIEYCWQPTPAYTGNGVGRVLNIWSFLRPLWSRAQAIASSFKPDIVIASSTYPMDIWVARRIARLCRAKLVFEVHDLWPLSPIELGGMSPSHPFIKVCQAAENAAYRHADLVVSMLPAIHGHAQAKGLDPTRLAIVPNGVVPEEWAKAGREPLQDEMRTVLEAAHRDGETIIGYAGSHGIPNALDNMFDAANLLRNEPCRFVLVGDGHERERLARRVQHERLDRVSMFAPIAKAQIPAFLALVDLAYLGAPRQPIYRFGVWPNKMLDYMMAGVPILYAIEAGNDPVSEAHCGVSIAPDDAVALARAIQTLRATGTGALQQMGENGQSYVRSRHTYDVLAAQFLDAIRSVAHRS